MISKFKLFARLKCVISHLQECVVCILGKTGFSQNPRHIETNKLKASANVWVLLNS